MTKEAEQKMPWTSGAIGKRLRGEYVGQILQERPDDLWNFEQHGGKTIDSVKAWQERRCRSLNK